MFDTARDTDIFWLYSLCSIPYRNFRRAHYYCPDRWRAGLFHF